jgi:hypothetical protein
LIWLQSLATKLNPSRITNLNKKIYSLNIFFYPRFSHSCSRSLVFFFLYFDLRLQKRKNLCYYYYLCLYYLFFSVILHIWSLHFSCKNQKKMKFITATNHRKYRN